MKKLKADRATFARLVIVAKARNISMRTILSYPLSPVSAALAGSDEQSSAKMTKIEIYTAVGKECKQLRFAPSSTPTVDDVLELNSDHEEADTRMILHAFHANANQSAKIVVCSPGTDVAVLLLHFISTRQSYTICYRRGKQKASIANFKNVGSPGRMCHQSFDWDSCHIRV